MTTESVITGTDPKERAERGRALRSRVPRSAHGEFAPGPDRPDPITVLEEQSARRVPELVPVRYGRMSESPFRFYRGAAAIMATDLHATPTTGLTVQLCGDAHLLNFRLLGSPERNLLFDINDFDETHPGPWEWDVKRLAASLVIAGRENGWDDNESQAAVHSCARSYREAMRSFAGMGELDVWYARADAYQLQAAVADRLAKSARKRLTAGLAKARTRDSRQAFEKLTEVVDGHRRITSAPPLITPLAEFAPDEDRAALQAAIRELLDRYGQTLPNDTRHLLRQYRIVDMAHKVVGVGSVGTRCWIVLLLGRDDQDPLFLQAKEAQHSVLEPFTQPCLFPTQGERVVAGQRLMQAASDIFLGWQQALGLDERRRDFYVRQLRDWKGIPQPSLWTPKDLTEFARLCGWTLARAHARSGDRIAIAAYLGRGRAFDHALARFAPLYADQNERDHQALLDAIRSERVPARHDL
ncbi:DUF2252 domain-containing protein [Streptacidiphilus pinicola]|uniref:DUF2252 domain-containing protein n=1 Tax=Streptacidiphilus pinicola TaxID=2219663 RepID=A0A2X0IAL5_9ACTN|nr:DUF2252 domain-containing protein [Streptacidiphilus pinicola]RAG81984.1 DUF2252 domain-containing protein [Streptacidiphilus pinicola]